MARGALRHTAYIGLGSNQGPRQETVRRALEDLGARPGVRVERVSAFVETAPEGGPPQGPYLNAAAELSTTLEPAALLAVLQAVEEMFGRERTVLWGPRTLDLDLLLYDDRVIEGPGLTVPHPLMHRRRFVLEPLCQIAPDAVHPVLRTTVRELLAGLNSAP